METSNNTMVQIETFIGTKNPNYFIVTFKDSEVELGDELHVTQFNTRLILKSNKDNKGSIVKMNTTPRD